MITWIATAGTLACVGLAGRKNFWAWPVGLAAQVLWLIFSFQVMDGGLLALNILVTILYAGNLLQWRKKKNDA